MGFIECLLLFGRKGGDGIKNAAGILSLGNWQEGHATVEMRKSGEGSGFVKKMTLLICWVWDSLIMEAVLQIAVYVGG